MRKSSKSISLALIGSALLMGGCQQAADDGEWSEGEDVAQAGAGPNAEGIATGNDQYNQNHSGGAGRTASRIGGAMIGSQIGRAMGGGVRPGYSGGGGMSASPSARGGFGSSSGFGASS